MKTKDALKIIDEGWIRKPKGFRVHFQKKVNSDLITDYIPDEDVKPLESDVVTWRLAWKLSEVTKSDNPEMADGEMVNIYVVDDLGNPIPFYGTNEFEILNKR